MAPSGYALNDSAAWDLYAKGQLPNPPMEALVYALGVSFVRSHPNATDHMHMSHAACGATCALCPVPHGY